MGSVARRIVRTVESLHPVMVKNTQGQVIFEGSVRRWNRIAVRARKHPKFREKLQAAMNAGERVDHL